MPVSGGAAAAAKPQPGHGQAGMGSPRCAPHPRTACPEEPPRDDLASWREMLSPACCCCPPRAAPSQHHRHFLAQAPAKPLGGLRLSAVRGPTGAAPSCRAHPYTSSSSPGLPAPRAPASSAPRRPASQGPASPAAPAPIPAPRPKAAHPTRTPGCGEASRDETGTHFHREASAARVRRSPGRAAPLPVTAPNSQFGWQLLRFHIRHCKKKVLTEPSDVPSFLGEPQS